MTEVIEEWATRADDGYGTIVVRDSEVTARKKLRGTGGYWTLLKRTVVVTPWVEVAE
jgi:hypothetical protein